MCVCVCVCVWGGSVNVIRVPQKRRREKERERGAQGDRGGLLSIKNVLVTGHRETARIFWDEGPL